LIGNKQKAIIHVYLQKIGMDRDSYEDLLHGCAGVVSSKELNRDQFQILMAELEKIAYSMNPLPNGLKPQGTFTKPESYGDLGPSAAQVKFILKLWKLLLDYLPEDDRNHHYLARIINKTHAQAKPVRLTQADTIDWCSLGKASASKTIDALKDRLKYAVKP